MQLNATQIYLAIEPVDMRLGVDGLSRLAQDHLQQNIGNGCCYVFSNRARTRLKALLWDGTGVWLCQRLLTALVGLLGLIKMLHFLSYQKRNGSGIPKGSIGSDWIPNWLMIGASKRAI